MDQKESNYSKYRGKCREMSEALIALNPGWTLVRGFYHCPFWGVQGHWWCKDEQGVIVDPTKLQFPSKGMGEYEEFNGMVECAECGKEVPEDKAIQMGNYGVCSDRCARSLVGI